jgi:uroporphyrinogen decarboxylase
MMHTQYTTNADSPAPPVGSALAATEASGGWTSRRRWDAVFGGELPDRPPLWMMRQAGRYLPEYRAIRTAHSFLEVCRSAELAAEVTVQPLRRFGFDAAILFSDILTVPEAMGQTLDFPKGGPTLRPVVRSAEDAERLLTHPDVGVSLGYVANALREIRRQVGAERYVLGFSGAPYTLACYMIEGGGSRSFPHIKGWLYRDPQGFAAFLNRIAGVVIDYLLMQLEAGADLVQLFDTWAGELSADDYRRVVLPSTVRIIEAVRAAGGRVTLFARHPGHLLEATLEAGAHCVGIDWRVPPDHAAALAAERGVVLQGNLDPVGLIAGPEVVRPRVAAIGEAMAGTCGHVMNLGHGILPTTPVAGVQALVEANTALAGRYASLRAAPGRA